MRALVTVYDVLIGAGGVLIVTGVALLSVPAALIVCGALLIGITAGSYRSQRGNNGTPNRMA